MILKMLISLSIFLTVINLTTSQWCTKLQRVKVSSYQTRHYIETYQTGGWFRDKKTRRAITSDLVYKYVTRAEFTCCAGYVMRNNDCEPQCTAGCSPHSICTQPGTCTCDSGYARRWDNICAPICQEPCPVHAICIAPDTCSCLEGYKYNEDLKKCMPECQYGCALNMYCQSPNQCACRTGYKLQTNTTGDEDETTVSNGARCLPVCRDGCPANSECFAPDECRCTEGYTMQIADEEGQFRSKGECAPVCVDQCPQHASCVSPNVCECALGYEMLNPPQHRRYCQALCTQNCELNGKCVAPDECECFPGYEHVNTTNANSDPQELYCQPVCSNGCAHGNCVGPEKCICQPGYLMGGQGVCEPTCTRECLNGRCIGVDVCKCNDGYQLSAHDLSKCEPICSKPCINADCIAPEICLCREKYRPMTGENLTNVCSPMCWPECVNGVCVAPDQCSCNEGYVRLSNSTQLHICEPYCSGCKGGYCETPSNCVCPEGSKLSVIGDTSECTTIVTSSMAAVVTIDDTTTSAIQTKTVISATDEVEVLSGTSIGNEIDALLQPIDLNKCTDTCDCWKETPSDECFVICGSKKTNCLEPQFSECIEPSKRIEYRVSDAPKIYTCFMNSSKDSLKTGAAAQPLRMTINGLIFAALMLAVFV